MSVDLKLSPNPDGYGFHYGTVDVDGEVHRVNVLPPIALWKGDMKLPKYQAHETDWIAFVNGEELHACVVEKISANSSTSGCWKANVECWFSVECELASHEASFLFAHNVQSGVCEDRVRRRGLADRPGHARSSAVSPDLVAALHATCTPGQDTTII